MGSGIFVSSNLEKVLDFFVIKVYICIPLMWYTDPFKTHQDRHFYLMFFENSVHSSKSAFAELQPITPVYTGINGQIISKL